MSAHSKHEQITLLANKLAYLIRLFRKKNNSTDFKFWNDLQRVFQPKFGCPKAKPLFDEIVNGIVKLNPKMLSTTQVERKLVYDFIQFQTINGYNHATDKELTDISREKISELVNFKETHCVQIPIYNLMLLKNEQYNLLGITLRKATKTDLTNCKKFFSVAWPSNTSIHSFACVQVEGDNNISTSGAITKVRRSFDLIRAFCFPFGKDSDAWNTGIVGDIPMRSSILMIIDQSQYPFKPNQRNMQIELETHILPKLTDAQWSLLDELQKKETTTQMQTKLLDSIHWLAEATKTDTKKAKFVKISLALENLLGSESDLNELKAQGLTVMLAERAAFIAGKNYRDRLDIDEKIRRYYNIRSAIMHGRKTEVNDSALDGFGLLVRRLAISLLERLSNSKQNLKNVNDLAKWVKDLKYKYVRSC